MSYLISFFNLAFTRPLELVFNSNNNTPLNAELSSPRESMAPKTRSQGREAVKESQNETLNEATAKINNLKTQNRKLERELRMLKNQLEGKANDSPKDKSSGGSKKKSRGGRVNKQNRKAKPKSTPPQSPGSKLVKRRGKRVSDGLVINPQRVLEGEDDKRFPPIDLPNSKGLWNEENFCYRNAVLQSLLHVPAFYRYLGMMHKDCHRIKMNCVVCALQYLAHTYWNVLDRHRSSSPGRVPGPYEPLRGFNYACTIEPPDQAQFPELAREFAKEEMSDAFDFLQWLLQDIQGKELTDDGTSFAHMFEMTIEGSWTCQDCGHTQTKSHDEGGRGLGIGLRIGIAEPKRHLALLEYIRHHFEERIQMRCEHTATCRTRYKKGDAGPERIFKKRITKTPEVLVLQLQRFHYPGGAVTRISDQVDFDEYLNLGELTTDGEDVIYRLDAVVGQQGSLEAGHYIAGVRESDGIKFAACDDDKHVGRTRKGRGTVAELNRPNDTTKLFDPYVLFYSRM